MNLIFDRWIPIQRADGCKSFIAPWELTNGINGNPILSVASPRPDFDGALTQFLIGLLQTACTPDEEGWWEWRPDEAPPSPDILKHHLMKLEPYFELDTVEGARFLQERLDDKAESHPVTYLLIGEPTDNALKQNIDHFRKRTYGGESLCFSCAAAALYTLQTFAPSGGGGGDGKFTSLRGGGPLTTLILGRNLWETAWINVIHGDAFTTRAPDCKTFPWIDPSAFITEEAPVKTISSMEMNPEHVFWGMPRRIQLDFSSDDEGSSGHNLICAVCGSAEKQMCIGYRDRTGGLSYQEEFEADGKSGKVTKSKRPSWIFPTHPLSPYTKTEEGRPLAVHPQPGGVGYRHWLGLIENDSDGRSQRMPASTVEQFRNTGEERLLWAFGFDMDNMKARCWYDAKMPILAIQEELKTPFRDAVSCMIKAAKQVAGDMTKYLRISLFDKKSKVRADALDFVQAEFWEMTESAFYMHLRKLRSVLANDPVAAPVLEGWLKALREAAFSLYDRYSQAGDFDAVEPRSIALARRDLSKALAGSLLREKILKLPKSTHAKTKAAKRKSS